MRLFVNARGTFQNKNGDWYTYGLGADGASDLIGWKTEKGRAVFVAIEVKKPGEGPTEDQQTFIDNVIRMGGIAGVARSVEDALAILGVAP